MDSNLTSLQRCHTAQPADVCEILTQRARESERELETWACVFNKRLVSKVLSVHSLLLWVHLEECVGTVRVWRDEVRRKEAACVEVGTVKKVTE